MSKDTWRLRQWAELDRGILLSSVKEKTPFLVPKLAGVTVDSDCKAAAAVGMMLSTNPDGTRLDQGEGRLFHTHSVAS